jgi:hypothetical protein
MKLSKHYSEWTKGHRENIRLQAETTIGYF